MADLGYALVCIGIFVVLALTLHGLPIVFLRSGPRL